MNCDGSKTELLRSPLRSKNQFAEQRLAVAQLE